MGIAVALADEFDCQPCPGNEWSHRGDTSCFKWRLAFLKWHEVPAFVVAMLAALGFLSTLSILVLEALPDIPGLFRWGPHVLPDAGAAAGGVPDGPHVCRAAHSLRVPLPPDLLHPLLHRLHILHRRALFPDHLRLQTGQLPPARLLLLGSLPPAYVFMVVMAALMVAIVVGSLLITTTSHPLARADPDDPKVMILSCNPNYGKGLLVNTSLDLLLSVAGFSFAYMGKELPTNYNEAKFITFCMTFYFTVSLCTFMFVYEGVLVTTLDILVTVLNLLGVRLGYFGPKSYVILFFPEHNTPAYFSSMMQGYTMGRESCCPLVEGWETLGIPDYYLLTVVSNWASLPCSLHPGCFYPPGGGCLKIFLSLKLFNLTRHCYS